MDYTRLYKDCYKELEEIGKGSSGKVYKVIPRNILNENE